MLGNVCDGRKAYTSMCDIVNDFWNGMNADELDIGRAALPTLSVAPCVGDDEGVTVKRSSNE